MSPFFKTFLFSTALGVFAHLGFTPHAFAISEEANFLKLGYKEVSSRRAFLGYILLRHSNHTKLFNNPNVFTKKIEDIIGIDESVLEAAVLSSKEPSPIHKFTVGRINEAAALYAPEVSSTSARSEIILVKNLSSHLVPQGVTPKEDMSVVNIFQAASQVDSRDHGNNGPVTLKAPSLSEMAQDRTQSAPAKVRAPANTIEQHQALNHGLSGIFPRPFSEMTSSQFEEESIKMRQRIENIEFSLEQEEKLKNFDLDKGDPSIIFPELKKFMDEDEKIDPSKEIGLTKEEKREEIFKKAESFFPQFFEEGRLTHDILAKVFFTPTDLLGKKNGHLLGTHFQLRSAFLPISLKEIIRLNYDENEEKISGLRAELIKTFENRENLSQKELDFKDKISSFSASNAADIITHKNILQEIAKSNPTYQGSCYQDIFKACEQFFEGHNAYVRAVKPLYAKERLALWYLNQAFEYQVEGRTDDLYLSPSFTVPLNTSFKNPQISLIVPCYSPSYAKYPGDPAKVQEKEHKNVGAFIPAQYEALASLTKLAVAMAEEKEYDMVTRVAQKEQEFLQHLEVKEVFDIFKQKSFREAFDPIGEYNGKDEAFKAYVAKEGAKFVCQELEAPKKFIELRLHLTFLGGGVFDAPAALRAEGLKRLFEILQNTPIKIYLHAYGLPAIKEAEAILQNPSIKELIQNYKVITDKEFLGAPVPPKPSAALLSKKGSKKPAQQEGAKDDFDLFGDETAKSPQLKKEEPQKEFNVEDDLFGEEEDTSKGEPKEILKSSPEKEFNVEEDLF